MPPNHPTPASVSLLSGLPSHLSKNLFNAATPVKLTADATLFTAGEEGNKLYRIPGLFITTRGTVRLYGEARRSTGKDLDEIDVLLRPSTDGEGNFGVLSRGLSPGTPSGG